MKFFFCVLVCAAMNVVVSSMNISFYPRAVDNLVVNQKSNVTVIFKNVHVENLIESLRNRNLTAVAKPVYVLTAVIFESSVYCENDDCNVTLELNGRFLGFGHVYVVYRDGSEKSVTLSSRLNVAVLKEETIATAIFVAFVATLVTVNYINMGCALDFEIIKQVVKRPIGPAVGFLCQFVVMPLVSYGIGYVIFDDPVLRLGLFTFGTSPGGGASNMWTVLLGGNLNLSITMTFISTLAALGTIPLWLFTLGKTIVKGTDIVIPYEKILTSLVLLTVPIGIGLLIQRYLPKTAAVVKRFLAPICIVMIIAIVVVASVTHAYIFYMLTWRMAVAASLSVWSGFAAGVLASCAFGLKREDVVAIAVETGIQNSGIAFVLLSGSLKPPASDIASVVPVAGSIITPVPLFAVWCCQRLRNCCFRSKSVELTPIKPKYNPVVSQKRTLNGVDNAALELENN